ncbi:hypothetical protein FPRO04_12449 [Fusarium proliferatum]|nr:hypothetical protein FPRO04_12449 [Fusarium proliferatum]
MSGTYIPVVGAIAAISLLSLLAYFPWRLKKRHANRRGADLEERPAGNFHELGSQTEDLYHLSEDQLQSGSGNNEPSLETQYQRARPRSLSVRPPLPNPQSLSGPENNEQLAKPLPCLKPLKSKPASLPMTRLTSGSGNELSLQAQPQLPPPVHKHLPQPKLQRPAFAHFCLVIPKPLILELGKEFPCRVEKKFAELHVDPPPGVCQLSGIIHHKTAAKEDLLAWKGLRMFEVASHDPEELWKEIKKLVRGELRELFPTLITDT